MADHVWQHPYRGGPEREMFECNATLAFIAVHTSRARLLAVVTATPCRYPSVLAKTAITSDVLSGGRTWLDAGWKVESVSLGESVTFTRER